jgi:hypothetical protein
MDFDIDIDLGNREDILKLIKHIPAAMNRQGTWSKHNTGVYVNPIPQNPFTGLATIDYTAAENLGYIKLDLLNNSVYQMVRDETHLNELLAKEPVWELLNHREFVEQVVHIGNHYELLKQMPEPVNSIPRLSMFISIIRPAKRHLAGLPWKEVAKTVWEKSTDGSYGFKRSHSCAYGHLVALHMNLLSESAVS